MSKRGHAICVPYPAQGHITPMLQFAMLLHSNGFHITFVNTIYNHNRFLHSRGPHSLDGLPSFRFESIPDGLPLPSEGSVEATQDIPELCRSTSKTCLGPFRDLITKLNKEGGPRVTCIVADGCMSFTMKAAEEFGIPEVAFWTMSGCGYLAYVHYRTLADRGLTPLKDERCITNGYLDTKVKIPGMKNIRLKDLPSFIRTTDPDDIMFNFLVNSVEESSKASAIIINTFESLEQEVLDSLRSIQHLPPIYSIGSLELLIDQMIPKHDAIRSINSSLWKEELGCIEWLNKKEPNSVVYVNFGSIAKITQNQLIEFAWGLANSKKQFLWIIRPDIVVDENSPTLLHDFVVETKERGMLASWCSQKDVLKHKAVGGFLTHSGWNSTLETINGGVPVISWPFFAEQQTNCRYSCVEWKIGMEIGSEAKRDEIEKLVTELMEGKKGKEMKKRAMEWKIKAEEAAKKPSGSSYKNLGRLIEDVLLPQN
ncbi:7-deoxyloganetin glucosyltransferase-like [Chenopodium quinoa]|uniref:Glycosyltransferase n=1 Tax=Chenopodium quinoa TaxID=63459 RepID=A0A803LGQ2_CHEQI|nr:7-deoxyloganetin glucosyltransferase-like [Chenopodium quinoa]